MSERIRKKYIIIVEFNYQVGNAGLHPLRVDMIIIMPYKFTLL
ncbi:hypothetical protein N9J72_00985 [Candidatus Gracilibacteria bacterium]|nr:hypothetical protein [Candidatus Gracilibacteria bacterium]